MDFVDKVVRKYITNFNKFVGGAMMYSFCGVEQFLCNTPSVFNIDSSVHFVLEVTAPRTVYKSICMAASMPVSSSISFLVRFEPATLKAAADALSLDGLGRQELRDGLRRATDALTQRGNVVERG
jgi:hypothetical protein